MKIWNIAVAFFLIIGLMSCGGDKSSSSSPDLPAPKKESTASASSEEGGSAKKTNRKGKLVFKQYCVACHGADGKLGISGATDLSTSTVTFEERIDQITNGKGMMTPYKDVLSETQIKDVAEYLDELLEG